MTQDEIIEMADKADEEADKVLNMKGEYHPNWHQVRDEIFAKLVAQHERDRVYAEELDLPKPRLTGKFSITAGKFKCTGCTGVWDNRSDAHHHSCKDYL